MCSGEFSPEENYVDDDGCATKAKQAANAQTGVSTDDKSVHLLDSTLSSSEVGTSNRRSKGSKECDTNMLPWGCIFACSSSAVSQLLTTIEQYI